MAFVDRIQITVRGGRGGKGCCAFAQPPYTRAPYPDGGNGGDGGCVIMRADPNVATLLDFRFRSEFVAERGRHGGGNGKTGRGGADCMIRVPVGTVVQDALTKKVLYDLVSPGEEIVIAKGGRGGAGNAGQMNISKDHGRKPGRGDFDSEAMPGLPGEKRELILELKLIADVGIVGFPNAGKSSLLARISTARPKVDSYPFTTRYPVLGVVSVGNDREPFVACDIPGLIEGANEGKGLGTEFLRHIERTRILVHVVDMAAVDGIEPLLAFERFNQELAAYGKELPLRAQIIAANKVDLPQGCDRLAAFEQAVGRPVWPTSCVTGDGIPALLKAISKELDSV